MRYETLSVTELTTHKIKPGAIPSHGRRNAEMLVKPFTYVGASGGTVAVGTLPPGAVIDKVEVGIMTAFAGTSPTIDVGVSGTVGAYLANTKVTEATVGTYANYPSATLTAQTDVVLTVGGTSLTAGAGVAIVLYHMT